jgi:hypothetical protein
MPAGMIKFLGLATNHCIAQAVIDELWIALEDGSFQKFGGPDEGGQD